MQYVVYGLWGLLSLALSLLLLPHRVEVQGEEGRCLVRLWLWCFLPVTLLRKPPRKPKKEKPPKVKKDKAPKKTKSDKPAKEAPKKRPMTAWELLEMLDAMLPHIGRGLARLLRTVTVTRCRFQLVVSAGDDPAATALRTGQVEAALYSLYAALAGLVRLRDYTPAVYPCFTDEGSGIALGRYRVAVRASLGAILAVALGLGLKLLFIAAKRKP